jgi:hypothetical protein
MLLSGIQVFHLTFTFTFTFKLKNNTWIPAQKRYRNDVIVGVASPRTSSSNAFIGDPGVSFGFQA